MKDLEAEGWKYYIIQKYLKTGKQSLRRSSMIINISKRISESVKGPVALK
jgi:hypothetical protein